MKLAYIILAHNAPKHLARLINRLQHPDDTFFVHIDAKVDLAMFKKEINSENVVFIKKRENGRWGGDGIVRATINALNEIVENPIKFEHVILLSGSDYFIKSPEEIRTFYTKNATKTWITYTPFPVKHLNHGGLDRINHYSFEFRGKRETALPIKWVNNYTFKGKVLNLILNAMMITKPKRVFPYGWTPYYGSQWWSLSNDALIFLVDFLKTHPDYLNYHKYSILPDEFFFQSILLNAYPKKELIVNDNMRYIIFPKDSSHPNTIVEADLVEILSSKKLFARKFGPKSNILSLIDNKIK